MITSTSAILNGSWIGNGEDTHYYFEWGTTTSYGNDTTLAPGVDGGSGVGVQSAAFELTGLQPYDRLPLPNCRQQFQRHDDWRGSDL